MIEESPIDLTRIIEVNSDELLTVVGGARRVSATVLLPIYNAAEHVLSAVEKLRSLINVDHEVIIVDDGSTDATWELLLEATLPERTTLVRIRQNVGVARARNFGLRLARGEYVWMIDGDDSWGSDSLAILLAAAKKSDAGLVVAQADKLIVSSGERAPVTTPSRLGYFSSSEMVAEVLGGGLRGHLWNKLFRLERLSQDPFPLLRSKSDYFMVIESVASLGDMIVIEDNVYEYRYQMGSITNASISTPLDLIRCYEAAMALLEDLPEKVVARSAVEKFRFQSIGQIVMSEVWRYGKKAQQGEVATSYVRGMLTWRGLAALAFEIPIKEFIVALALKTAPTLLGRIYRRGRRHRWTSN